MQGTEINMAIVQCEGSDIAENTYEHEQKMRSLYFIAFSRERERERDQTKPFFTCVTYLIKDKSWWLSTIEEYNNNIGLKLLSFYHHNMQQVSAS